MIPLYLDDKSTLRALYNFLVFFVVKKFKHKEHQEIIQRSQSF
jgi:hypothetical protein